MKRLLRVVLVALVLVGVLAGGLVVLLATPQGVATLAAIATRLSAGHLAIEGVRGDLAGTLTLERLRIETASRRIDIRGVRLEWTPRALLARTLDIRLLAAESLTLREIKPAPDAPWAAPASLKLPLAVHVARASLGELVLARPGSTQTFRDLAARLDGRGDAWVLERLRVTTPWARVEGKLVLAKAHPFRLDGTLTASRELALPGDAALRDRLNATLALDGSLVAPGFDLRATAFGLEFLARGRAAPFARIKLPQLVIAGQGIDPRRFAPDAPQAKLAFSGVFQSDAEQRLLGTLSLINALPGRLDQGRVPFAQLTTVLAGDRDAVTAKLLEIDLGKIGVLRGDASWKAGRFSLQLIGDALDLAAANSSFVRSRLQLGIQARGDLETQFVELALGDVWGAGWLALERRADTLTLRQARFEGAAGTLAATGRLEPDAQRFQLRFDAARIDPSRLGRFPQAQLNLRGSANGEFGAALRVAATFDLPPGQLEGRPVSGRGRVLIDGARLADADIMLDLAGNRVVLKGRAGRPNDVLQWDIVAPVLDRLRLGFAGSATSRGRLVGEFTAPQLTGTASARGLRLPGGVALTQLDLTADLRAHPDGPFDAKLDARGVDVAGQRIERLSFSLAGRRDAHAATLDVELATSTLRAQLAARGGLDANRVWTGTLDRLQIDGDWPLALQAPARVSVARERQRIDALRLVHRQADGTPAELWIAFVEHAQAADGARRWATQGQFSGLASAPWLARLAPDIGLASDVVVAGNWSFAANATLDGEITLRRTAGDLRFKKPAPATGMHALGVSELALDATIRANVVRAGLRFSSATQGRVLLDAATALQLVGGIPAYAKTTPLTATLKASLPDLALARLFVPPAVRVDAALALDLALAGSVLAPQVSGELRARGIRVEYPEEGVRIRDGTLTLALAEGRVRVRDSELVGTRGRIVIEGMAEIDSQRGGIDARFERFSLLDRSDRKVDLSGTAKLTYAAGRIGLGGTLKADRARLRMPEAARPKLSQDVVIAGQSVPEKRGRALPFDLNLNLDLGEDFLFDGAGLDARLEGTLRVFTVAEQLRGEGALRVAEGRYAAYGQTLTIARGVLRFVGPLDNPGLDLLAVRTTPTVTAGVQVTGTVLRPRATLYSDPALPDAEKLSWLVLGRGLSGGGAEEFALLQVAAGAVLNRTQSVNLQAQIANTLGIDSFDLRAGDGETVESAVVAVGKRLSSRTLLTYEQSLDGLSRVVKVIYQYTPRLRFEASTGVESSFDAFYSVEYD